MILKNLKIFIFFLCLVSTQAKSDTFGKTHFIVGFPHSKKLSTQANKPEQTSSIWRTYTSSKHNLETRIIDLINKEKTSIKIAVYFFTSSAIADALMRAKERGIAIEVVTDQSCIANKFECISKLAKGGIPTYVYTDKGGALMHHKFAVFGSNEENKRIVWNGSYNFTKNGTRRNQENAIVSDHTGIVDVLDQEFTDLKKICAPFGSAQHATTSPVVAQAHQKKFEPFNKSWIRARVAEVFKKFKQVARLL